MFTITAENLGPIAKGTVELKPLTIFVGPSNTGKSYMATAVYALMKAFQHRRLIAPRLIYFGSGIYTDQPFLYRGFLDIPNSGSSTAEAAWKWARQLKYEGLDPDDLTVGSMPEELRAHVEQSASEELGRVHHDAQALFKQAFGEPAEFVSRSAQPEHFRVALHRDDPLLDMEIQLADHTAPISHFDISQVSIEPSPLALLEYAPKPNEEPEDIEYLVFSSWADSIATTVLEGVPGGSFYFPASRSGMMQGYKIMASELVRQSSGLGGVSRYVPTLPGITAEFLGNLISLDRRMLRRRRHRRELVSAINFIENEVLHGAIDLDESGGLPTPDIVYLPTDTDSQTGKFTLEHTSSMVSELAPLILFLKYLVNPGDLLILEEPESHLHPAAQRQMARGIVRLVNAGVKVLITTHSDFFVGQVNNLLRLSFADDAELARLGLRREDCLGHDNVAAYNFIPGVSGTGSVVEQLPIRKDVGIEDAEFGKVVNALYEQTTAAQRIPIK